ncbi:MAG: hypothetical protein H6738_06325 [Alphaproteobacteria bacterium]|nr:hypothetical protein [Alphaproteobacteria bacterium]MCB9696379.1 hypothetical protein [Alphaproteobacteria bacterium]
MNTDLQGFAHRLSLTYNGEHELIGERDGVVVRLDVSTDGYGFAAQIPARGFGETIGLRSIADLFEVRELDGRPLRLDRGWLTLHDGQPPEETLALLVRAARAAAAWWRRPVTQLVERHGLRASEDLSQLWGEVRGRPVEITEARRRDGVVGVTVRADLPEVWAAVRLVRPSDDDPAVKVGDPILDRRIAVTGISPTGVALLRGDIAREALLAVLYDHGGMVRAGTVYAFGDSLRDAVRIERMLRDTVDLASALSAGEP